MLPRFNASMVLPPYTGDDPTQAATMSPYKAGFLEFAQQFATSRPRTDILNGLLAYREALRNAGITTGFQWFDGSFVEDVEQAKGRPPGDIDVVTFGYAPRFPDPVAYRAWVAQHQALFNPRETKRLHNCDAYFVDLNVRPDLIVDKTRYWFGLFSHQRETALWKGMVQVPLDSDDVDARDLMQNLQFDDQGGDDA
ncbi:hypothetical protein M3I54_40670 [Paraburkholderia sp. CNPSo 3274]|uniref:DUF6932 family protein n=1 Tax=Paraburkholderia sp. CNPSo 3274 TaxID=2940932 RepID=UPI0020B7D9AE|nr:hypothetical protein [Paraburkholderia sp. CNPSo 3274]MCP3713126.1 hypothetical protein [Paraburkholderia sp. CNPSo 3274]